MSNEYDVIVVGGGAAGFFAAINTAEKNPKLKIAILERGREVLQKVKVSGGGRCNVTHACFDPEKLVKFYPRGESELLKPFQKFNPKNTIEWFENRGVKLKTESDGRMFPVTDSSQTIIDCFLSSAHKNRIEILTNTRVEDFDFNENSAFQWSVFGSNDRVFRAKKLIVTTGSDSAIWKLLTELQVKIISPVPSLFTFKIEDKRLNDLMGLSVGNVECRMKNVELYSSGAILVTHWGLSGPAILKLSAWGARHLAEQNYNFTLLVNWLNLQSQEVQNHLHSLINSQPKKNVIANAEFGLPIRLWKKLCEAAEIKEFQKWAETGKKHIAKLTEQLTQSAFEVNGKSTFKEEFVTAGGVDLDEFDFEKYSLKKYPNLYLAGEVLNIDAITGGFNFQAAWTGGWMISESISSEF